MTELGIGWINMYQGYYHNENHSYQGCYSDGESEESFGQTVHFKEDPEEL